MIDPAGGKARDLGLAVASWTLSALAAYVAEHADAAHDAPTLARWTTGSPGTLRGLRPVAAARAALATFLPVNTRRGFDLRSTSLTLLALKLQTLDPALLEQDFSQQTAEAPGLFDQEAVVLDLAAVCHAAEPLCAAELLALVRRHGLLPVAARGGSPEQMAALLEAGLPEAEAAPRTPVEPAPAPAATAAPAAPVVAAATATAPIPVPTLVIERPLRSGQQVYARGGDLVVLAAVSFGAEAIADGSIHVYGPLRGRAIAGARGDASARIYSTCMEPQLIAIAGTYRTTDTPLADAVRGKAAFARLDGNALSVEPLGD